MNRTSKIITFLAAGAMSLTSCSLFGTEISEDEAITQLHSMQEAMEAKYGEIDIEENLPEDLQYLYVEGKGYNYIDGEMVNAKASYFISLAEGDFYGITKEEEKSKDGTKKQESYIVCNEDNDWISWDIIGGELGEVEVDPYAALGLVLVYAMFIAMATPEYGINELEDEDTEGISFKKYSDTSLDIKYSVPHEKTDEEDDDYVKEIKTISYNNNMATKIVEERIDEEGKKIMEQTMTIELGKKKEAKPAIPPLTAKPA